jgi:O-antigen biosynthesis protein
MREPSISVVVPTRNRADQAVACAEALLRCSEIEEIVFVDQSEGDATELGLRGLGAATIRCVRSSLRGAANGRNTGIDATTGRIIAFTDDDCRAAPDWVTCIKSIFDADPDVGIVCGRVYAPDYLRDKGFTTEFEPDRREWQRQFPPPDRDWGITANFAARREIFTDLGRFDPMLGAGTALRAGEEPDLIFRVLKAGRKVINAREVQVEHLGVRSFGQPSSDLWRSYGVGTAAALFKHVRLGDPDAAKLFLSHLATMGRVILRNVLRGQRPLGAGYTLALLSGAAASLRFGVDRSTRLYVDRAKTVGR